MVEKSDLGQWWCLHLSQNVWHFRRLGRILKKGERERERGQRGNGDREMCLTFLRGQEEDLMRHVCDFFFWKSRVW